MERGRSGEVDWRRVAEEIRDLGKRDKREFRSLLALTVTHLLLVKHAPQSQSARHRRHEIQTFRRQMHLLLEDSPGLKNAQTVESALADAWEYGCSAASVKLARAGGQRRLAALTGNRCCPWTFEEISAWHDDRRVRLERINTLPNDIERSLDKGLDRGQG